MSIYETDFSRRLRSSVPLSPGSSKLYSTRNLTPGPADVFGDITSPMGNGNASPRAGSPGSARKGKAAMRDYGDRSVMPFYFVAWLMIDSFQRGTVVWTCMRVISCCPKSITSLERRYPQSQRTGGEAGTLLEQIKMFVEVSCVFFTATKAHKQRRPTQRSITFSRAKCSLLLVLSMLHPLELWLHRLSNDHKGDL